MDYEALFFFSLKIRATVHKQQQSINLCKFGVQIAYLEEFDHAYNACNPFLAWSQTIQIMQAQSGAHK